jgi:hypothetical protein
MKRRLWECTSGTPTISIDREDLEEVKIFCCQWKNGGGSQHWIGGTTARFKKLSNIWKSRKIS